MKPVFFEVEAFQDLQFWGQNDVKLLRKIVELIADIQKTPFTGLGKPEALKHDYKGFWSRKINDEHRLVYRVNDSAIVIVACRFHYK
jgi:toxin YoeB